MSLHISVPQLCHCNQWCCSDGWCVQRLAGCRAGTCAHALEETIILGGFLHSLLGLPGWLKCPDTPEAGREGVCSSYNDGQMEGLLPTVTVSKGRSGQVILFYRIPHPLGILGLQNSHREIMHPTNMETFMYLQFSLNFYQERFSKCNMC